LSEAEIREVTAELISMFANLQRKRIAHRNIKPANIALINDQNKSEGKGKFRIFNFELASKLPEHQDLIQFAGDTCSIIYASPYILGEFNREAASPLRMTKKNYYSPFKEDVFSLGLSILQLALFSTC
jgi:serine/threonine protein kinase